MLYGAPPDVYTAVRILTFLPFRTVTILDHHTAYRIGKSDTIYDNTNNNIHLSGGK